MVELSRSDQFIARCDFRKRFVLLYRTNVPFNAVSDLDVAFAGLERGLAGVTKSAFGLLVDTRDGPVRNDPVFEVAFERHRRKLFAHFAKRAVLVRTAAGKLQVQRHAISDKLDVLVTDQEDQALAYLGVSRAEWMFART
jgi:hypothetical protein